MTMSKDQQQAEIMNNGREKREVRERKEREIKKRAFWEYKMIFFFFFLQSNYSELVSKNFGIP